MSHLVLAYPVIEKKDYDFIQSFRKKFDERYFNLVEPHFTIIFPILDIKEKVLIEHVQKVSEKIKEFYFVLRCAQIVKDSFSDYTDIFLIPEEGYRIFVKLHDALYTGPIGNELRLDIPFIPHIGIGNSKDAGICKKLADELNSRDIEIFGAVNKLNIVSFDNAKVTTIKEIIL